LAIQAKKKAVFATFLNIELIYKNSGKF